MDDHDISVPGSGGETAGGGMTIFLSLFFLVLAFFILLVTISTLEEIRTQAVMDSLTSTFSTVLPPTTELTAFAAKEGEVIAGQQFQTQISGVFTTALQVARVEIVQPGRLMRVTMPANALFFDGETRLRPARQPLLDRIVAALSSRPPGLKFDLEFIVGADYTVGGGLPIGQNLEMARGGAFVREMMSRGAPPDSLSIGLQPGLPGEIIAWFYTRFPDEERLRFEGILGKDP